MDPRENIYCLRTQATVIKIERKKGRIGLVQHSVYRGAYIDLNGASSDFKPMVSIFVQLSKRGGGEGGHLVSYSMVLTGSLRGCWSGGRRETAPCGYSTHESER